MTIQKMLTIPLATTMLCSALLADVEDDIFKSGVERTLQVLEYQKNLTEKDENFEGKLCYHIYPKDGEVKLSNFQVVKLEALSLIADTDPFYYQANGKKELCFFVAKDADTYKAYKKLIENKYEDIAAFHPKKTTVPKGAEPILPKLGEWHIDMSGTITTLNREIAILKKENNKKQKELKDFRATLKKIVSAVKNISSKKLSEKSTVKLHNKPVNNSTVSNKRAKEEKVDLDKIKQEQIKKTVKPIRI